jgi:tetratricopeptide (TPR) repeat protein
MQKLVPFFVMICLLTLGGCGWGGPSYWLGQYQARIEHGTRTIETAQDDTGRAAGHTERARGYAERARYSRVFKLIDIREYDRLFDQALLDHEAAVGLDPRTAENFFARGLTYHDRAWAVRQDNFGSPADERYWPLAADDFTKAIELDSTREQAFDMRGISREHLREYDGAIADYTKVQQSDARLGGIRLADLYCERGNLRLGERNYADAAADYERSVSIGAPTDGCSCDPYSSLASTYLQLGDNEKFRLTVQRAQARRRWIAPEVLEQLKKIS